MRLSFYTVNPEYCNYLRQYDARVPYNYDAKKNRPFVGIVYSLQDYQYYAPLTSPKPKHQTMKNQVDFLKIENGVYGAINFNNMIPVTQDQLQKADLTISPTDPKYERDYKNLLINQLSWCNANREVIINSASKLYALISMGKDYVQLQERCCNFKLLESVCDGNLPVLELGTPSEPPKTSIAATLEDAKQKSEDMERRKQIIKRAQDYEIDL